MTLNLIQKIAVITSRKNVDCYLVGGFWRDFILKKETFDLDFAVEKQSRLISRQLAKELNASWVILDDKNEIYRVVIKGENKNFQLDFSDFKGKDLQGDLCRRDFTINALAGRIFPEMASFKSLRVLDLFGGKKDIKKRIIRMVSPLVLKADPLRILRAYRFAATLGFKIEPHTEKIISASVNSIRKVSKERIRDEFFKILSITGSYVYLLRMDEKKLLTAILPEIENIRNVAKIYYPRQGVWGHSLDGLKFLEELSLDLKKYFPKYAPKISNFLERNICGDRNRFSIIKLAMLCHDLGKPGTLKKIDGRIRFFGHEGLGADLTKKVLKNLCLSQKEEKLICLLVRNHMRPHNLACLASVTQKAIFRFFRDTGEEGIGLLLLCLADHMTYLNSGSIEGLPTLKKYIFFTRKMLAWFYDREKETPSQKLVNGYEVMKVCKIPPGPQVGKCISALEEAQALGKIKNKEDAFNFLRKMKICKKIKTR